MNSDRQVSLQHNGAATKRTAERERDESTIGNKQRGPGRPRKMAKREEVCEEDVDGEDFEQWLAEFKTKTSRIEENRKMELFKAYMGSKARECMKGLNEQDINTFDKLSFEMRKLVCKTNPEHYLLDLMIAQMVKKAYPMIADSILLEKLKLENFLRGLSNDLAAMVCKEQLFVNEIKSKEPYSEGGDKRRTNQSTSKADANKNNDSKNLENNLSTLYQKINKQKNSNFDLKHSNEPDQGKLALKTPTYPNETRKCYHCHQVGHIRPYFPNRV
ncbi:hypothetical protein BpHYR1_019007 [Brachionus plicatilis]|uniref:Uncharacterized protein n=1 Tax=Brachionus plicatilis TaxID=10195 RepID=A0A3M7RPX9_BRAPC|nr:hypothetical protein BpHYR1_019007 [Brachionus plicatilis]